MTLREHQELFARDVADLIKHIVDQGYTCTLGEAYRPPETAELYAKQGKGSANSLHCKRLAVDINLFYKGEYLTSTDAHKPFGDYWCSLSAHNRWGGVGNDGNHYSRTPEGGSW